MTDMTSLQYALYQAAPERIANDLKWLNKLTDVIGAAGANDEAIRLLFCMSADVRSVGLALDGRTLTDTAAANRLHELAGKYDMAAERLRAALARIGGAS